ncbi:TPA: hypothetical protein QEM95_07120 [Stenotrophomonas maltophilia]|nr:hypothetical protein [Stenotrophomonas maltophilia]
MRGVSRIDAAAKPTWTYLRRPRNPTPPRQPTEYRSGSGSGSGFGRCRCIEQVQGCKPCRNPPNHDCSHLPEAAALAKVRQLT